MSQRKKGALSFENGGFNQPKVVLDIESYEDKKNKQKKEKKLGYIRDSIKVVQKETRKRYAEKKMGGHLFIGPEICEIDPGKLTESDLELYEQFKDFKKGKLPPNDFFSILGRYRYQLAEYQSFLRDRKPDYDFSGDSRTQFLAWLQNKWIEEMIRRRKKEKEQKLEALEN